MISTILVIKLTNCGISVKIFDDKSNVNNVLIIPNSFGTIFRLLLYNFNTSKFINLPILEDIKVNLLSPRSNSLRLIRLYNSYNGKN